MIANTSSPLRPAGVVKRPDESLLKQNAAASPMAKHIDTGHDA